MLPLRFVWSLLQENFSTFCEQEKWRPYNHCPQILQSKSNRTCSWKAPLHDSLKSFTSGIIQWWFTSVVDDLPQSTYRCYCACRFTAELSFNHSWQIKWSTKWSCGISYEAQKKQTLPASPCGQIGAWAALTVIPCSSLLSSATRSRSS